MAIYDFQDVSLLVGWWKSPKFTWPFVFGIISPTDCMPVTPQFVISTGRDDVIVNSPIQPPDSWGFVVPLPRLRTLSSSGNYIIWHTDRSVLEHH